MKKIVIPIVIFIVLIVGSIIFLMSFDFNRFGKSHAYIEVIEPTELIEDQLSSGEIMKRYSYTQSAIKEDGEEIKITFTANKELRQGAYLKMYLDKNGNVTSYDEISFENTPTEVQEKL